ncbi:MAG: DUF4013 domain-containing protein [Candidatus Kaiserbacteria bacterium]|nr:DUF4013 domain-containing protein [Candidatus Kaiserbacteria bacterium]
MNTRYRQSDFWNAIVYPYRRKQGLLNILWLFIPIVGWLFLIGYVTRIVQSFCEGKVKELPEAKAVDHIGTGFFILIKSLPFTIIYGLVALSLAATPAVFLVYLFGYVAAPFLGIHFLYHERAGAYFEWGIFRHAYNHAAEYFLAVGKTYLLMAVYTGIHFMIMVPVIGILLIKNSPESLLSAGELILPIFFFAVVFLAALAANMFTPNIFIATFYRRRILRKR